MRILVTGSRYATSAHEGLITEILGRWYTRRFSVSLFPLDDPLILVHGNAPGVDTIASHWAGASEEPHPAEWSMGRMAGPFRNQQMVDLGAEEAFAFPMKDSHLPPGAQKGNRGTMDCIGRILKAEIPLRVVWL